MKIDGKIVIITTLLIFSISSIFWAQILRVTAGVPEEHTINRVNVSFKDAEAKFVVYPNGKVMMAGALNCTNVTPQYIGPATRGNVRINKSGDFTFAFMNCTFIIPSEFTSEFSHYLTTVSLLEEYSGGIFNTEINCSLTLPLSKKTSFPFNLLGFTVTGEYSNNIVNGTVVVHLFPGITSCDLNVNFQGNRTNLYVSGVPKVIYGTYYDFELNKTYVEELLKEFRNTIPGRKVGSLYNMTDGLFECTRLQISKTDVNGGAIVNFEMDIMGDFIHALAVTMSKAIGERISEKTIDNYILIHTILSTAYSSVDNAFFQLAYAGSQGTLKLKLTTVEYADEFREDMVLTLLEMLSSEMSPLIDLFIESLPNTMLCSLKSYRKSLTFEDGRVDFKATYTIEGDLDAAINYIKNRSITYFISYPNRSHIEFGFFPPYTWNYSLPPPESLLWRLQFVNETLIEVSNLTVSFNLNKTSIGSNFKGLTVQPPLDDKKASNFTLRRFFSLTEDVSFPGKGERLKVTIEGGSNRTHVIKLIRPDTVPKPDEISPDERCMVWYNQTISDLRDLIFSIQPAKPPLWTQRARMLFWLLVASLAALIAVGGGLRRHLLR